MSQYRHNHYVAQWYQKRFMLPGGDKLFYRDLNPPESRDRRGRIVHRAAMVRRLGPRKCFAERDLYTRFFRSEPSMAIEQLFFGEVDDRGKLAVEAFSDYSVEKALPVYNDLLEYMGAQKLRTPKGLGWIASQAKSSDFNAVLQLMMSNHRMYHAIWSECVWQVADASRSPTKFIVSDHPVTVYNRRCGPSSDWCRGYNDPDLVLAATQTIFPLSLEKALLLTNLTWARHPYQNPIRPRPNPELTRIGVFKAMDVQVERYLNEREVREINFIIKSRALRYVAAAEEEWLYPEKHVSKSDWARFGNGYLLMPDPRPLFMGGTMYMAYNDGSTYANDEYGRQPGEAGFESRGETIDEGITLDRFKGEFARLCGPHRRGRIIRPSGELEPERDSDEVHAYHLRLEQQNRKLMKGYRRW